MIIDKTTINRLVILIGLFNLVTFGYLTIRSIYGVFDRYLVFTRLTKDNQALDTKFTYLKQNELLSATYDGYIKALVYAIPESMELQEYLTLVNTNAGQAGFILKTYRPTLEEPGKISVFAEFRGGQENVSQLIKSLEALPRLTRIKSIKVTKEKSLYRVEANMEIFFLKK